MFDFDNHVNNNIFVILKFFYYFYLLTLILEVHPEWSHMKGGVPLTLKRDLPGSPYGRSRSNFYFIYKPIF
jgi:hypothetical protein